MERIGREERQRGRMFNVLHGKELVVVHLHGQEEVLHGEVHLQLEQSGCASDYLSACPREKVDLLLCHAAAEPTPHQCTAAV